MIPVFDSDIVIDFLEGSFQAQAEIESYPKRLISIITYIEAMTGIRSTQRQVIVKAMLRGEFDIVPLTDDIVEHSIMIRRQHRLKLPDAVIWATAMQRDTLLVTRNSKDFPRNNPAIRIPYALKGH